MARPLSATLTLASASPRRRDLLRQIGIVPDAVCPADIDETPEPGERPRALAHRLALGKARAVAAEGYVLAADTVVAVGRRLLPKTLDRESADACLRLMSGRAHMVFTGVCVRAPCGREAVRVVATRVQMKRLTDVERVWYLDSGDWSGKAGGYGIQGPAGAFVRGLNGSYTGVVGLPLFETRQLLVGLGWPAPGSSPEAGAPPAPM